MADLPPGMYTKGRHPDPHFRGEERLFRRFDPDDLEDGELSVASIDLPDMSVIREKYGEPAWLLLDDDVKHWGVLAFRVADIPPKKEWWQEGTALYVLDAFHVPHAKNYPHAEVRVSRDGTRVCKESKNLDLLDPAFHLRWRAILLHKCRIVLSPGGAGEA